MDTMRIVAVVVFAAVLLVLVFRLKGRAKH
jgi:hypothetical protein